MDNIGERDGTRELKLFVRKKIKMEILLKILRLVQNSMNQMEKKLRNLIVKNGAKMNKLKRNGMKNGVKFIFLFKNRNGVTNGN